MLKELYMTKRKEFSFPRIEMLFVMISDLIEEFHQGRKKRLFEANV